MGFFRWDPSHQKRAMALATIFGSKLTEKSQMRAMAPAGYRREFSTAWTESGGVEGWRSTYIIFGGAFLSAGTLFFLGLKS